MRAKLPVKLPSEQGEQQLDIHKPKPVHNWREFVGEVGIIVIGVLIALAGEQLVEWLHWQERVGSAEAALREEMTFNAISMGERIAVQPCLRGQIARLYQQLSENSPAWSAMPMQYASTSWIPVVPSAYRAPTRVWVTDRWSGVGTDGTLAHIIDERSAQYSVIYRGIRNIEELQALEASAATKLSYLASDRTLAPGDRVALSAALAEVDRVNGLMTLASRQALGEIQALHVDLDRPATRRVVHRLWQAQRRSRGRCVEPIQLSQPR